jgi:tetratricopeptide (TPR) repeat protein
MAAVACLTLAAMQAHAQDASGRRRPARANARARTMSPVETRPAPPPSAEVSLAELGPEAGEVVEVGPQIYEDFNYPDPSRPWGRARYHRPYRRYGSWYHRRYRGGDRRYFYDDYTYRFGVPYGDPFENDLEQAYRQGVSDGRNYERFDIQAERGLDSYLGAMADGHEAFFQGRYGRAARFFLLAAELNQGDPSARLCAAHCETALRHYAPAARLLQRALELQPRLVYLPLDIRSAYGVGGDFERHLAALKTAVQSDPDHAGLHLLYGYYQYFSGRPADAARAVTRAAELAPDDRTVARFARAVSMSVPASRGD